MFWDLMSCLLACHQSLSRASMVAKKEGRRASFSLGSLGGGIEGAAFQSAYNKAGMVHVDLSDDVPARDLGHGFLKENLGSDTGRCAYRCAYYTPSKPPLRSGSCCLMDDDDCVVAYVGP